MTETLFRRKPQPKHIANLSLTRPLVNPFSNTKLFMNYGTYHQASYITFQTELQLCSQLRVTCYEDLSEPVCCYSCWQLTFSSRNAVLIQTFVINQVPLTKVLVVLERGIQVLLYSPKRQREVNEISNIVYLSEPVCCYSCWQLTFSSRNAVLIQTFVINQVPFTKVLVVLENIVYKVSSTITYLATTESAWTNGKSTKKMQTNPLQQWWRQYLQNRMKKPNQEWKDCSILLIMWQRQVSHSKNSRVCVIYKRRMV